MDGNHGKALVLAAGGVAGIAWELGLLRGLEEQGVDVRDADLVVGTSAGSVVAARICSGRPLAELAAAELAAPAQPPEDGLTVDAARFRQALEAVILTTPPDPRQIRARIGALALATPAMPEAAWRAAIAALLPRPDWPAQPLMITAVDAATGEPVQFTRDSGVSLLDAVAASCAVPGVWPPVTIGDRRYMDGGVRSLTNADLVTGYARVLILLPSAPLPPTPFFGSPEREQALLEAQGSAVLLVHADAAALEAIGPNALDPARRAESARAGQTQGRAVAAQVRAFWTGAGA